MTSPSNERLAFLLEALVHCVCTSLGNAVPSILSIFRLLINLRHHAQLYRKRCKALGIEPNPRALFRVPPTDGFVPFLIRSLDTDSPRLSQTHLEGVVTREPRSATFSTVGLLDHIIELVICEDEVSASLY